MPRPESPAPASTNRRVVPQAAIRHRPAPSRAQQLEEEPTGGEVEQRPVRQVAPKPGVKPLKPGSNQVCIATLREGTLYGLGDKHFHKDVPQRCTIAEAEILETKTVVYAQTRAGRRPQPLEIQRFDIQYPKGYVKPVYVPEEENDEYEETGTEGQE